MTTHVKNISQPFDVNGVKMCQFAEFVSGNIPQSLVLLGAQYPEHAPWVTVGGWGTDEPATPVQDIVVETVPAVWWPDPGMELVSFQAE